MSTTTTTYAVTMADLKTDSQHGSLWSNYGSPVQMPGRFNNHLDSAVANPSSASPHLGRPRSSNPGMDYPPYHYGRHAQDDAAQYDRQQQHHHHQQPPLQTHHSFPNLKRPYPHAEQQQQQQPPFTEIVQDLREDSSNNKLSVNHDHKLLSFRRTQDKHTIVDQHGRIQQLELSAQLHGMFFLSEMPSSTNEGTILQPELTCYRRNLFQVSGSLVTPRSPISVVTETGETVPVSSTEVTISAVESADGHPVRLIVIPWKTPPPNSPEISQTPDQEPPSLPLIPFQDDGPEPVEGEYAVYPIGWRRLQFRIATANNGRRKELQQHFIVHLKVVGALTNGTKVVLTESTTAPIVVRGRSPRNFQARKEIPLLGSSAGSRGQALVETGLGIVPGPLTTKPQDPKPRPLNLDLPRTTFTFSAPKLPPSPMAMRSNSYPTPWNQPGQMPMGHLPTSGPTYPPTTLAAEPYQKSAMPAMQNFNPDSQEVPLQTSMPQVQLSLAAPDQQQAPVRTQYATYVQSTSAPHQLPLSATADSSLGVPRYMDDGPRPSKSPRHTSHPSVHSASSVTNDSASTEYRYGPPYVGVSSASGEMGHQSHHAPAYGNAGHDPASAPSSASTAAPPSRDYFPPSQSWTTTAGEPTAPSVSYTNGEHRPYPFPDQYKSGHGAGKPEAHHPPPHSASSVYHGQAMNHYPWNAA